MAKTKTTTTTTPPDAASPVSPLVTRFLAARRAAVPLVWIATPDPAATVAAIAQAVAATVREPAPMVLWDCVRGIQPINEAAQPFVARVRGADVCGFTDAVSTLNAPPNPDGTPRGLPARGLAFMLNAHLGLTDNGQPVPSALQAAWNARDGFKVDRRMLVCLAPHATVPGEVRHDVIVLDEPLPDAAALAGIVRDQFEAAKLPAPSVEDVDRAVDRLTGLAAFSAEQVTAMSLGPAGLDLDALTVEQARVINATPGLVVHRVTDDDDPGLMHGCENAVSFGAQLFAGARPPRGIVWIDEIEKAFGGLAGDTSGTTQDQLGVVLQEMQELQADGVMYVGHPGTGKSMLAKALARQHRRPLIRLDLGAAKHGVVGSSEERVRAAFKTIRAVTGGAALFVATSNGLGLIPPELRRRFKLGTFMFELPGPAEVAALFQTYLRHHGVDASRGPRVLAGYADWTGAEIATVCMLASRLGGTVDEAADYVVPVARSMPERITRLREEAHGRYLDARRRGVYRAAGAASAEPVLMTVGRVARAYGES